MRNRTPQAKGTKPASVRDTADHWRPGRPKKLANSILTLQGEVYAWPGDAPRTPSGRRRTQMPYLLISGPGLAALGFEVGRRYRMKPDGPERLLLVVEPA